MLTALNSSASFGKAQSKIGNNYIEGLKKEKSLNKKEKFGAETSVLLGYTVGYKVIDKFSKGKSYAWNTSLNKTIKNMTKKIPEKFGLNKSINILDKLSKTSGRQKMQGALAVSAGLTLLSVANHFSMKNGEINAKIQQ
ncbi:hypothetical protein J6O48_12905 [bacterium]|nr:hypothetical protein [bacterium]